MANWDATTPAGSDLVSLGDDIIVEMKVAIQAALQSNGEFPGDNPTTAPTYIPHYFEADTSCIFYQAAAPTGWTRDETAGLNDKFISIVVAGSPGTTGGTHAASINIGTHTHTGPSHDHTFSDAHTHGLTPGAAWAQFSRESNNRQYINSVNIADWTSNYYSDQVLWASSSSASAANGIGLGGVTDNGTAEGTTGADGDGNTGAASIGSGSYAQAYCMVATKDAYA